MRVVIQRVSEASVKIDNKLKSQINNGLLILLGISEIDSFEDVQWLCSKIINLRVFNDNFKVMNLSLKDINADILLSSQFTLFASTK